MCVDLSQARAGCVPPALFALVLAGCARPVLPPPPPAPVPVSIQLVNDNGDLFQVTGLDPSAAANLSLPGVDIKTWTNLFAVTANDNPTPMLGSFAVEMGFLRFRPRWPLVPGIRYTATFHPDKQPGGQNFGPAVVATFTLPKPPLPPPATVARLYPSGDRLPENLLRVYLHFTGPMRRGDVYDHIRLLGPGGKPVPSPFVTLGEELWNDEATRLTLLLDPGRQKHDLLPRQQMGPVLEAGKSYTLVIDGDIRDAHDRPTGKEFRKRFDAVAAETRPVQPAEWKITPPPAGRREPLVVAFDRLMDHAMVRRVVTVTDTSGNAVEGDVTTDDAETRWRFMPRQPWAAGEYALVVEAQLEDVCGNRVGRAFEVDEDRTEPVPMAAVRRNFKIETPDPKSHE
jgi:hypothetical protein